MQIHSQKHEKCKNQNTKKKYKYMSVFDGWRKSVRDRPINATGRCCLEYRGANTQYKL